MGLEMILAVVAGLLGKRQTLLILMVVICGNKEQLLLLGALSRQTAPEHQPRLAFKPTLLAHMESSFNLPTACILETHLINHETTSLSPSSASGRACVWAKLRLAHLASSSRPDERRDRLRLLVGRNQQPFWRSRMVRACRGRFKQHRRNPVECSGRSMDYLFFQRVQQCSNFTVCNLHSI